MNTELFFLNGVEMTPLQAGCCLTQLSSDSCHPSSMENHHGGLVKLSYKDRGKKLRLIGAERTIFVNLSSQAILIFSGVSGLLSLSGPGRPLSRRAALIASWMAKNTEHPRNIPDSPRPWQGNMATRSWLSLYISVCVCMNVRISCTCTSMDTYVHVCIH